MKSESSRQPELVKALGPLEATTILVGSVIGSGIFLVPSSIATNLGNMGLILLVWVVSGFLTFFGTLTYAELASLLPKTGGPYVYLRESYGNLWAFLFGWMDYFVNKAGSAAAVAVAFATYLGYLVPQVSAEHRLFASSWDVFGKSIGFSFSTNQAVAIGVIALLTFVNYRGTKLGGWVQNVFTLAKVFALAALVLLIFTLGKGSAANYQPWWPQNFHGGLISAFGLAMVATLWAYDGWAAVTYVAGEMREPQKNVPLGLLLGTTLVVVIYLAVNLAYSYVLPLQKIAASHLVAADAIETFLGPVGGSLIAVMVMVSTFGAVNGMILSGARITFAMSSDRVFFDKMAEVHPRFRTPYVSVLVLGIWAALLTLTGTFEQLMTYVVFAVWIFYGITASSVIVFRRKMPDAPRPYRAWGYPWVTCLFVVVAFGFVLNTLIQDPRDAGMGLILILIGVPFYAYWRRKGTRREPQKA